MHFGNFLRHIKVESKPFDLVVINETVVAVTLTKAKIVLFIDLNHDNVVKSFSTVEECYGIINIYGVWLFRFCFLHRLPMTTKTDIQWFCLAFDVTDTFY
jgi:hypothetical protein